MNKTTKRILAPIASLRLTVVLLSLAMIVILAGTTAQEHMGIWQVQERYFHSWFCKIDLDLLFPLVKTHIPGSIPMLGGYTLIALLLANLLTAHALRFKVSPWDIVLLPMLGFFLAILWAWQNNGYANWLMALACAVALAFVVGVFAVHKKRGGVILIHLGLIMLLVGELVTSLVAVESRMKIDEGGYANYSYDVREPELVLADTSSPHQDQIYAIDAGRLRQGDTIADAKLPAGVRVKVDRYYPNSDLVRSTSEKAASAPAVTKDVVLSGTPVSAVGQPPYSGAGDQASKVDLPSAYVTLTKSSGETIGTFLASTMTNPTRIDIDGKPFDLSLRFRRHYVPFRIELKDFRFDRYAGTNTAKNYAAHVRLVDPTRSEDRDVVISMNAPLRYAGLTFYQASFDEKTEQTTELQVVRNPGWLIPYLSCVIGGLGLITHFSILLVAFLGRVLAPAPGTVGAAAARKSGKQPPPPRGGRGKKNAPIDKAGRDDAGTSYTLQPTRGWGTASVVMAVLMGLVGIGYVLSISTRPAPKPDPYDLAGFGKIALSFGGRQQPLDSLARNHLKVISGREEFTDAADNKQPAIRWLADLMVGQAREHKVFNIDHADIKSIIASHLPTPGEKETPIAERRFFSIDDLAPAFPELYRQMELVKHVPDRDRNLFQKKIWDLYRQMDMVFNLQQIGGLFVVPPEGTSQEWRPLGQVIEAAGGPENTTGAAAEFLGVLRAYKEQGPAAFNQAVTQYRALLGREVPATMAKADLETRFNRAAPFIACIGLYVLVFLLAAGSWLGWSGPLRRGAWVLLLVTLSFHTIALVGRMYLSGRPPVTNLYSSAIFIAWGMAVFATLLELVFRNGVGSAAAALTAVPSLVIAHYLSFNGTGDTMEVLQAVLDTNFWLATHVVAITLGYAATFLAGFLGILYLFLGIATPALRDDGVRKTLSRMIYGILCFAILFSFIGTVLGGIWADQSWGRFWGWDPKENGAVLIVLWNAVILHARWGGLVRERGLATLAVFGNIVTAWSWFGTNMLGVGLHSYGFMDSAVFWLAAFVFLQVAIIAVAAFLPQRLWLSARSAGPQGRGFEPKVATPRLAPGPAA